LAQTGDVILYQGATLTAPVLAQTGYVILYQGATLTAPVLAQTGDVRLYQGATLTAPVLAQTGDVILYQGATLTAPVLAQTGDVILYQGATLTAPVLAQLLEKIGYKKIKNTESISPGWYITTLTNKEFDYMLRLKKVVDLNRLFMGHWHQNENWKNQTVAYIENECNTTHCVAGWIQIWEKDQYNGLSPEEAGRIVAPNLSKFFYLSNEDMEKYINTAASMQ
jgi:predicted small integral membrane protein